MNMHRSLNRQALDTLDARRDAADRAIAKARAMPAQLLGYASDVLIADRRAEFWNEEAKSIQLHG